MSPSASASSAYDSDFAIAVTGETTGVNVWTQSSVTGAMQFKPEQACRLNTTGAALTLDGTQVKTDDVVVAAERLRISITGAGAGKRSGTFDFWVGQ